MKKLLILLLSAALILTACSDSEDRCTGHRVD